MTIYRSPHPPIAIPDVPLTDFVLAGAAARGDRAALVEASTGRTIPYAELPGLVDRAAAALACRGIGKGDVCAIFSPNTPEFAIAVLAIARLGAIVTTASPLCTRDDLVRQFGDSKPRILFTSAAVGETALAAVELFRLKAEATAFGGGTSAAVGETTLAAVELFRLTPFAKATVVKKAEATGVEGDT